MRTSAQFVFYVACLLLGKMAQKSHLALSSSVYQQRGLISAVAGEEVTLRCFYEGEDSAWLYWYKQPLGQKPRLISSVYVYDTKTFHNEFKNNPRFRLDTENSSHHLTIFGLQVSDSATYYCAASFRFVLNFAEGTTVSVRERESFNIPLLVSQPESETIQPGDSVTLNCTVHTGTCDGGHSVYWFRNSEESHPGFVYAHGGRNDQCERKPNTQSHTCVYNLPMKRLNLSHVGTYYCAVASCGRIMIGNGTKLDIRGDVDSPGLLVYFLSGALTVATTLVIFLILLLYNMNKNSQSTERRFSARSTANSEGMNQDADSLHYAALSVNLSSRSRTQRNQDECVYSSVRR